jgi:energy-coupling factor transporter ATP-binding protein EcfA2
MSGGSEPKGGISLGDAFTSSGSRTEVRLEDGDLDRSAWVLGQSGSGKSTLLQRMVVAEAEAGNGLMVIDPHGPLIDDLLAMLPKCRHNDIVLVDAGDSERLIPINPLEVSSEVEGEAVIQDLGEMFYDLFDPNRTGIVGPRFEAWLHMATRTLMAGSPKPAASFLDVPRLFLDDDFLRRRLADVTDPVVKEFWVGEMARTSDFHRSEMLAYFSSKFERFRTNRTLRRILGTGIDALPLDAAMDSRRIVLIKLDKSRLGAVNSRLLGYLWMNKLWTAALRRQGRNSFTVYIDEAHNFTASALPALASEGRKWGIRLVIAHQFAHQLRPEVANALMGNAATTVAFRLGQTDAEQLGALFSPEFRSVDLRYLGNFHAACLMLVDGRPMRPFTLFGMPPPHTTVLHARDVVEMSRDRWSIEADVVDELLSLGITG